jgi:hypothetical protein
MHHLLDREALHVSVEDLDVDSVLAKDRGDVQDTEGLKTILGLVAWQQRRIAEKHLHKTFS